ncbi:hypothetical protein B296_00020525 [Ensete ventricosum]|uniref:Uncharacterized protein n=1 Tax=Ensete ventricosum TaxID=4639 RepID=A0A427ADR2_ENSVE|nr:hypothetical protein B296_00020525 [Ensete ventricosum]
MDRSLPGDTLDAALYRAIWGCFRPITARNRSIMVDFDRRCPLSGSISLAATWLQRERGRCLRPENLRTAPQMRTLRANDLFTAIEAVATKEELAHLAFLCRSEVDSVGRIAAGMLRLLRLDKSLGQGAIDQLSNLGSGSIDTVLTPEKLSRRSSFSSVSFTPRTPISNAILESPNESMESTITMLEVEILDLQSKCSSLISELDSSDGSEHVSDVKYLTEKLENMQTLLTRLRTLV